MRPGFYTRKSVTGLGWVMGRGGASMRPGFYTRKSIVPRIWSDGKLAASMRPGFYTRKSSAQPNCALRRAKLQ